MTERSVQPLDRQLVGVKLTLLLNLRTVTVDPNRTFRGLGLLSSAVPVGNGGSRAYDASRRRPVNCGGRAERDQRAEPSVAIAKGRVIALIESVEAEGFCAATRHAPDLLGPII